MSEEGEEDDEVKKAREILSNRPGFLPRSLPTKGGPKYFGCCNTIQEKAKVSEKLRKYEDVLKAQKVRKLCNLGRAEWLPEFGVAKITKQGKFFQHMGHHYTSSGNSFFALFPEEALFLLDIGDMELTFNGVPLALQDAFGLLFGNNNTPNKCTLSEYTVYSYLVKQGYIVRRFSEENSIESDESNKRKSSFINMKQKSSKTLKQDSVKDLLQPVQSTGADIELDGEFPSRQWWLDPDLPTSEICDASKMMVNISIFKSDSATFPDLSDMKCRHIPKPSSDLLPEDTSLDDYTVSDIWFERISRDTSSSSPQMQYSFSRKVDLAGIAKVAKSWSQYKEMVENQRKENDENYVKLLNKMRSGEVSPVAHPKDATTSKKVLEKLQIFDKETEIRKQIETVDFTIKFNIYKSHPTQPFKKTNPGRPSARIVVTDIGSQVPAMEVYSSLNAKSNGVPVKYAIMDYGQISFFSFDNVNLPTIVT